MADCEKPFVRVAEPCPFCKTEMKKKWMEAEAGKETFWICPGCGMIWRIYKRFGSNC